MSKVEWFRRETWNEKDQQEFFERLNRSRSKFHKAQYLRIQACHLEDKYPEVANHLLDKLLDEFPEKTQLASTYLQKAMLMVRFMRNKEAIEYFRKAIQQERDFPNVKTAAYLEYGKFVVSRNLEAYFKEIENLIKEFGGDEFFAVQSYETFGIQAAIFNQKGRFEIAREYAEKALEYADLKHSGLSYHPDVGLVDKDKDVDFNKLLNRIVKNEV